MSDEIKNKVAGSGIIQLDLEELVPSGERVLYDIKQNLWQELVLKEEDFRNFIKANDWSIYKDKCVALTCSTDAIVPTWAYMLLISALKPFAKKVIYGNLETLNTLLWVESLKQLDTDEYNDKRVVVKGCGTIPVPEAAFTELTNILLPRVKSLMFGEPCSTVPVFKKK
jgi:Protein of unknown function (DUF2480)